MERKLSLLIRLGYSAASASIVLWILFVFFNPYSSGLVRGSAVTTFLMLLLPALLFTAGIALRRSSLLIIAFLWSLPYSLYMAMTPGIFLLFGLTSFLYLLCFVLFRIHDIRG